MTVFNHVYWSQPLSLSSWSPIKLLNEEQYSYKSRLVSLKEWKLDPNKVIKELIRFLWPSTKFSMEKYRYDLRRKCTLRLMRLDTWDVWGTLWWEAWLAEVGSWGIAFQSTTMFHCWSHCSVSWPIKMGTMTTQTPVVQIKLLHLSCLYHQGLHPLNCEPK